jgi:ABC-2 type transport system permease protein
VSVFRLVWLFVRLGVMNELEYRTNFFFQLFQTALGLAASLAQLAIIFSHTESFAGWRPAEMIGLLGVFFVVGGAIRTFIQPSMQRFMEDVRQGTLDFTLTKPEDAQVLVSVKQVQVWKLVDIALGVGILLVALGQLQTAVGWAQALAFGISLFSGGAIVYSIYLLLATMAFWFVRVENVLVIFQSLYQAARWPVGIYPGWLRAILTAVVPVAFATTVPAEALAGRLTGQTLLTAVGLAAAMLVLSSKLALSRIAAGSNTTTSAAMPGRIRPRSWSRNLAAGHPVILCTACSSVSHPLSRAHVARMYAVQPKLAGWFTLS